MKLKTGNKPLNLIILGDPGAGKATQAAYIAKKYGMLDYDMGKELAKLREQDVEVEKVQQKTADKGQLTPTKIVQKLNRGFITKAPKSKGILFDGHPKMLAEAEAVKALLKKTKRTDPLVIYIRIPKSEIKMRLKLRAGYGIPGNKKRADDNAKALKNRAKYYKSEIEAVKEFFGKCYSYATVDGMGTKAQVKARMNKVIQRYLAEYPGLSANRMTIHFNDKTRW